MTEALFRRYAWGVTILVLGVIAWGAYVRATGSGAGCGPDWPTCRGSILPHSPSSQTLIEYAHRLTSGLSAFAVVGLVVLSRRATAPGSPARRAAAFSLGFMIAEALLGAALVLFQWVAFNASAARALAMSVHLVNTFLLLASLALTVHFASGGAPLALRGQGAGAPLMVVGAAALCLVGVSGALAALVGTLSSSAGAKGDSAQAARALLRLRFLHPLAALTVGAYVMAAAAFLIRRRPRDVQSRAFAFAGLFGMQILAGALNVVLRAPVWMQLLHLALADAVWIAFVLLGAASLRRTAIAPLASSARVGLAEAAARSGLPSGGG